MKITVLSISLAVFTVAALMIVRATWIDPSPPRAESKHSGESLHAIEACELRLDRLEAELRSTQELASRRAARSAVERDAAHDEAPTSRSASLRMHDNPRGQDEALHDVVARLMTEIRMEEAASREARARQVHEGPYGVHNFRMNTLGAILELSEDQMADFFDLLIHFESLVREQDELEALDPANSTSCDAARNQLRAEFGELVVEILDPEQARIFRDLLAIAREPGGRAPEAPLVTPSARALTLSPPSAVVVDLPEADHGAVAESPRAARSRRQE